MKSNNIKETMAKYIFFICAFTTVISLGTITYFIFIKGVPGILKIGVSEFLFGTVWDPRQELFGILPMLQTSIVVTAVSSVFGAYIGKWTAIYLVFYCNKKIYKVIKPMIELLSGIPSVIFGFFGAMVLVPIIRDNFGGAGKSMLAAIIILIIMVLPTIINLSESALRSVPKNYYEGAVALGTTHNEAVFKVVVPAAKSGMISSYILGIGKALGETMAIILVAGNSPRIPFEVLDPSLESKISSVFSIFADFLKPMRTLTTGISMEMGYASGLHQDALFGIGVVLFILIFLLNVVLNLFFRKGAFNS